MFMMYFIHDVLTDVLQPLLWPSSGWRYYKDTKVQMWLAMLLSPHNNWNWFEPIYHTIYTSPTRWITTHIAVSSITPHRQQF